MTGSSGHFIIAGAQRSGTTTLYHLLEDHPAICMARPLVPEPKYFLRPDHERGDAAHYRAIHFAHAASEPVLGEKTVSYLEDAAVPARILATLPDARIVFLLRELVERAVSNYWFSRNNGIETGDFESAVRDEDRRIAANPMPRFSHHPLAYIRRGRYATFLRPYFEAFGRERIHVLFLEELAADPRPVLAALAGFLGIDEAGFSGATAERFNESTKGEPILTPALRGELAAVFAPSNAELSELLGRPLPW